MFQFIVNGLIAGSVYALVALGFSLIYGTVRFFHLAHAGVYTAGAYLMYTFFILWELPFFVSIIIACILTGLLGIGIEYSIYKPMRNKGADKLTFLIASLGIFICLQNLISLIFGDDVKNIRMNIVSEGHKILGARITDIQIIIILTSLFLFVGVYLILKYTRIGKLISAVANNQMLASTAGIDIQKVIYFTFFIGSILAAFASILVSLDLDMTPMMGFNTLLYGIIAVIIGGYGNILGAYLGGIFLGLLQQLGVWQLTTKWQESIAFIILLLFLLFRPQGFLGKSIKKAVV